MLNISSSFVPLIYSLALATSSCARGEDDADRVDWRGRREEKGGRGEEKRSGACRDTYTGGTALSGMITLYRCRCHQRGRGSGPRTSAHRDEWCACGCISVSNTRARARTRAIPRWPGIIKGRGGLFLWEIQQRDTVISKRPFFKPVITTGLLDLHSRN